MVLAEQTSFQSKYDFIYHHGMTLMGIKKPLVNPATADKTGERRMAFSGNVSMSQISRAVQVWLRVIFTKTIWRNSSRFQRCISTNCSNRRNW